MTCGNSWKEDNYGKEDDRHQGTIEKYLEKGNYIIIHDMKTERYNKIKAVMPDSLRMKLDHIKRYLDEGKAAALIGAGFSKNARMPEVAEMKDWNALGIEFYKRLYGEPKPEDLRFQNPINLATQVEASFGRHELDNMIQQSLPDDVIIPSKIHVDLLNLGWHDLFTTNYDTLLERACLDADHPYTIVYNKDTLLYSVSPRIVKLHGSFPNIRPYIITEEDYRTYPQRYPEFVNTVRQSLIENLFCLIGFSGDDPNFKSWLGWLRDVMGQQISPVYFITYDKNLHDSRRNLLAKQKIEVLNLYDLQQVEGIQDAFDFFFTYLKVESNTLWRGKLREHSNKIEDADKIKRLTEDMAGVRNRYPRWLVLPKKYYDDFGDVRTSMLFWTKIPEIKGLTPKEWIQFLYELKWRMEVSLTPIGVDWYVNALEELTLDDTENESVVIDLKLSLLTHYRIVGKELQYVELTEQLVSRKSQLKPEQLRRFYYDRCLMASSKMQYNELRTYLSEWSVFDTDFVGVLWKSAMLIEANMNSEALNLLNRTSTQIRKTILSNQQESYFFKSCQIAIERALYLYGQPVEYKGYSTCDYLVEMEYFKEQLNKKTVYGKATTKTHGFNVDDIKTTWHMGASGYVGGYLNPYRYYALCERVGMPAGMPGKSINTEDHILFLSKYISFNHYYPIGILARSCNAKVVSNVLSRKTMATFNRELADNFFDAFFEYANQLDKISDNFVWSHIYESCIPILVRLCSKTSADRVKKMGLFLQQAHGHYGAFEVRKENEYIKTVNNSLLVADMEDLVAKIFEMPIVMTDEDEDDYYCPIGWTLGISFGSVAVQNVCDGLVNPDKNVQEAAFLRGYQLLRGIVSEEDKNKLKDAIISWRNNTKVMQHICFSFIDVPAVECDKYSHAYFLKKYVKDLLSTDVNDVRNSVIFDHIANCYRQINYCSDLLKTIDGTDIIMQFSNLVHKNEKLLRQDDDEFFGGFRSNMSNVVEEFFRVLSSLDLTTIGINILEELADADRILGEIGYPYLAILELLQRYNCGVKEVDIKNKIDNMITTSATMRQVMDVVHALLILNERGRSYQSQLYQIVSLCEYSTDRTVSYWLYAIYHLAEKHAIKETGKSKIYHLLETKFVSNNYSEGDADWLNDVRHGASLIAGAIANEWGDTEVTDKWKNLMEEDSGEFNDVSCAFERALKGKPIS